jgi:peptidoglycan/LPS O-acetylase OafA/YrhL
MAAAALKAEPAPNRFYLPELDGLRFFAFLAVFIAHSGPGTTLFQMGTFGVDLFFCLSAYLITELLVREKGRFGALDVPAFYVRRALRIWPLYFGFLAGCALVTTIARAYFMWCAVFLGNFGFALLGEPNNIIFPLWSVSVEEQFYFLWPWAIRHCSRRGLATLAVVVWLVSICFRYLVRAHPALYLYCTFGRLDSIAAGILLSCALSAYPLRLSPLARTLSSLAGGYLWLLGGTCAKAGVVTPVYALVALGCCLFLLATIGSTGWIRRRLLVYLGRISYGLYIFHGAALIAARALFPALAVPVAVLISLGVAAASYRWFEAPFLRLKRRFERVASRPA